MRWTIEEYEEYQKKQAARMVKPPRIDIKGKNKPVEGLREKPYTIKPSRCPTRGWDDKTKMTKTEMKYLREVLGGCGRFEPVTLVLAGGSRYTPDFMTVDEGVVTFHEVKGSYRLQSYNRARTAFHEAAAAFPIFRFVWAEWSGKEWKVTTLEALEE